MMGHIINCTSALVKRQTTKKLIPNEECSIFCDAVESIIALLRSTLGHVKPAALDRTSPLLPSFIANCFPSVHIKEQPDHFSCMSTYRKALVKANARSEEESKEHPTFSHSLGWRPLCWAVLAENETSCRTGRSAAADIVRSLLMKSDNPIDAVTRKIPQMSKATIAHLAVARKRPNLGILTTIAEVAADFALIKDEYGETVLHYAARYSCDLEVFRYLFEANPPAAIAQGRQRMTPAHILLQRTDFEESLLTIFNFLVQSDSRVLLVGDEKGSSPLHYACHPTTKGPRNTEVIRSMLELLPEAGGRTNVEGTYPLHLICSWGESPATCENKENPVAEEEEEEDEDVGIGRFDDTSSSGRCSNDDGNSCQPSTSYCQRPRRPAEHSSTAELLHIIEKLIDICPQASYSVDIVGGMLPLHTACNAGMHLEIVRVLYEACPAAIAAKFKGDAGTWMVDYKSFNALHFAAMKCSAETVAYLVERYKADGRDNEAPAVASTPAANHGNHVNGEDEVDEEDEEEEMEKFSPFHLAVEFSTDMEVLKILCKHYKHALTQPDFMGLTPLSIFVAKFGSMLLQNPFCWRYPQYERFMYLISQCPQAVAVGCPMTMDPLYTPIEQLRDKMVILGDRVKSDRIYRVMLNVCPDKDYFREARVSLNFDARRAAMLLFFGSEEGGEGNSTSALSAAHSSTSNISSNSISCSSSSSSCSTSSNSDSNTTSNRLDSCLWLLRQRGDHQLIRTVVMFL